ncbi:hypothetical protein M569_00748, partial [Genlisea aurea]
PDLEKFKALVRSPEKFAKVTVYVQDALGGANATVWQIASASVTDSNQFSFGKLCAVDDLLTVGTDKNSTKLGRVQGTIAYTSIFDELALTMDLIFYFTSGPYKGSTLCLGGRNPLLSKNREMPVTAGSGTFRLARGYAIANTISYDAATNYGVLEYTFYVTY